MSNIQGNNNNDMQIPLNIGPFENNFDPYLPTEFHSNSDLLARLNDMIMSDDNDDHDQSAGKKKSHKHTSQQTQELETFFNQCSHPNGSQRAELGKRLGLDGDQVKFWFQNRRAKSKNKIKLDENLNLKRENERLQEENKKLKDALENPICETCRGMSFEQFQLELENAQLKAELSQLTAWTQKLLGESAASGSVPMPLPTVGSGSDLTATQNSFDGLDNKMHDMELDVEGDSEVPPPMSVQIPGLEI